MKEVYEGVETIRKPKSFRPPIGQPAQPVGQPNQFKLSQALEAIPATETEELRLRRSLENGPSELKKVVETVKFENYKSVRRHDTVEEYRIEDDPNFDSVIYVDHRKRKQKIFTPFFTSAEQRLLLKAGKTKSKLLAIGALFGSLVFVAVVFLCFLVVKIMGNFFK